MPLNIKNERAHVLAQEISRETGESLTQVVLSALEEKRARVALAKRPDTVRVEIQEIIDRIASRPAKDARTADEIIGYDENGLPS